MQVNHEFEFRDNKGSRSISVLLVYLIIDQSEYLACYLHALNYLFYALS